MKRDLTEWEMAALEELVRQRLKQEDLSITLRCNFLRLQEDLSRSTIITIHDTITYKQENTNANCS